MDAKGRRAVNVLRILGAGVPTHHLGRKRGPHGVRRSAGHSRPGDQGQQTKTKTGTAMLQGPRGERRYLPFVSHLIWQRVSGEVRTVSSQHLKVL